MDEIIELFSPEVIGTPQGELDPTKWVNIWRLALQDPAAPGYYTAVRLAVNTTFGVWQMAQATFSSLELDAMQEQAARGIQTELVELGNKLAVLRASAAATSDPSALWQGVVVPLLWKGIMFRTLSMLNRIQSLHATAITWQWAGFEWQGEEHDWFEYSGSRLMGAGRIVTWAYHQLQTSAPGEAPTVRDRLSKALGYVRATVKAVVTTVKGQGWGLGELVALGIGLYVVKEATKG